MRPAQSPQPAPSLPELRQELRIERSAVDPGGAPTWVVIDPVQHRYVQIDETAYHLLSRWAASMPYQDFVELIRAEFGADISEEDVASFVRFAADNNLTVEPSSGNWRHYSGIAARSEHGWLMWMVHNYLYVRLPLVRPEPFLKRSLHFVAPLYTRTFLLFILSLGLIGLFLVSRQWDVFTKTFQYFFSWQGAATYAVALTIVKSAHELGHAFTAVRMGCRVPSMGICFLVMFPVLYTDVTDAWRLQNRRERLMIGAAGVVVELALACVATFLWPFLPEGIFKSLAFSIATVGWVLSLAINLNPLMRFDGYYLFADALGIDNLQSRAFAFGQWRLREILFDLRKPMPERLPPRTALILTVYAWAVWLYRLIVFTGIAILVYHMAFKVLGIVLFLIEIIFFVLKPILGEVRRWWTDGNAIIGTRRTWLSASLACGLALVALIPWSTRVYVPAIVEASALTRIYPLRAGFVERVLVKPGDRVTAGQVLVAMTSDDVEHQIELTQNKVALIIMRLARRSSDEEDRLKSLSLEQELRSFNTTLEGLRKEFSELRVMAPFAGVVAELNPMVHPGRAIGRNEFIALVRGDGPVVARGYLSGDDIDRVGGKNSGVFIGDVPGSRGIPVQLTEIAKAGSPQIEVPELASQFGGPIAVRPHAGDGRNRRLIPVKASYLASMTVDPGAQAPDFSARGVVVLRGESQSFAGRAWRQMAAVLVRESGF